MQIHLRSLVVLLWFWGICEAVCVNSSHYGDGQPVVFVGITTIPARFNSISQSIVHWFLQNRVPDKVVLFLPEVYIRFRRRNSESNVLSNHALLASRIFKDEALAPYKDKIEIYPMTQDWGPATKFVGAIKYTTQSMYQQQNEQTIKTKEVNVQGGVGLFRSSSLDVKGCDFWLFADDDVTYDPRTLSHYLTVYRQQKQQQQEQLFEREGRCDSNTNINTSLSALTHFAKDYRLVYQLAHEVKPRRVTHIQGVDTYIIPSSVFILATTSLRPVSMLGPIDINISNEHIFVKTLTYIHKLCSSAAFYQDDYVISFLLDMFNVQVSSVWDNYSVAGHLNGVSKQNFQMHTSDKVFQREEAVKTCLAEHANDIYQFIDANCL